MSMPDKNMDELFRSKLEGFEAEPSANVWAGISKQLGAGKRRRVVPIWSIAASVALFVAAGVFFLPKAKVQNVHQPKNNKMVSVVKPAQTKVQPATPVVKNITVAPVQTSATPTMQIAKNTVKHVSKTIGSKSFTNKGAPDASTQDQPQNNTVPQPELIAAVAPTEKPVSSQHVVPDVPLLPKATVAETPVLASVATNSNTKQTRKRHGAFTLGDLINNVVGAVDKRADKVIEFSDTDDDQSTITGINLGFVRIKKEKK